MTGMLGNSPKRHWQGGCGGGCCNTKADDRHAKRGVKIIEKREVQQQVAAETAPEEFPETLDYDDAHFDCRFDQGHVIIAGNCIFCGADDHDIGRTGFPVGEVCESRDGTPFKYRAGDPIAD